MLILFWTPEKYKVLYKKTGCQLDTTRKKESENMASYHVVCVKNMGELENEIKKDTAVILISNKNIAKEIRKKCDEDTAASKEAKELLKKGVKNIPTGAGIAAVGIIGGLLCPFVGIGVGLFAGGILGGGFIAGKGALRTVDSAATAIWAHSGIVKNYKWFDSNGQTILYKYRGANKFDPLKDTVIGYENSSKEAENSSNFEKNASKNVSK